MAYQSLYRRYRPRRFAEVRGQEHLVRALQNAVRDDRVGHAYLFSGPRGTGKTTSARILAKVLNCEDPVDGEPCGTCAPCVAIEAGTSFDVHELDAASNNKVDDIRDLIAKASLGTPGRTKVYILDEVHMLTPAASNALLKTLEEPPEHVVFVLATTDPQKVLPTIRSRTQHFEVHLLNADDLRSLVTDVAADAGLDVDDDAVEYVVRAGAGSARDTLSALDQVVAAGGVPEAIDAVGELVEALCDLDTGRALLAVEQATNEGQNPRVLGEALIARLRDVFLTAVGSDAARLTDRDRIQVTDQAQRLGAAGSTRAIEVLGEAFVAIAEAPDQRIPLEIALVRLTRPDADLSPAALAQRIERLERGAPAGGGAGVPPAATHAAPDRATPGDARATTATTAPTPRDTVDEPAGEPADVDAPGDASSDDEPPAAAPGEGGRPADAAREVLARTRKSGPGSNRSGSRARPPTKAAPARGAVGDDTAGPGDTSEAVDPQPPGSSAAAGPERTTEGGAPNDRAVTSAAAPRTSPEASRAPSDGTGAIPTRDELTLAWGDSILASLPQRARARFGGGRWLGTTETAAQYALPNEMHRGRCEDVRGTVEEALEAHFGRPVHVELVVETDGPGSRAAADAAARPDSAGGPGDPGDEWVDVDELDDADPARSHVDRVADIFPGAELVEE